MLQEHYELMRMLSYPIGTGGLLYLAMMFPKLRIAFISISFYFMMWATLLIIQIDNPEGYRTIANIVSTPALALIVLMLWVNVWVVRKE